ncbi:glycosyltransferase family 2 protein [Aerosakkonemataceae cyanobacterium BLCC-F50]|uniref:Glycosyltransferase family 2 protein n=1 Tax=Floridaenema flaviceps BLCC-F50 TaxID=3153642 RepID=A0ABV4XYA5_9CYAN
MTKVSLYVPCYNVEKFISRCIEGILNQTYPVDEILIIDDGSKDKTVEIASQYPVRIIKHEVNKGLSAGRNTGWQNARNELVASLDADCVADSHWLENLVATIEENSQIALVGGRLVEIVQESIADRWRKVHMTQDWGDLRVDNPTFIYGNNNVIRKSAVEKIAGYDEKLRTNGEDVDISSRLSEKGYKLVYQPSAIVSHLRQDNLPSILDTYWRYWRYGIKMYWERIRVKDIAYNTYFIFYRTIFLTCFNRDKQQKNYDLLWIDAVLFFYLVYRSFKLLVEHNYLGKKLR